MTTGKRDRLLRILLQISGFITRNLLEFLDVFSSSPKKKRKKIHADTGHKC